MTQEININQIEFLDELFNEWSGFFLKYKMALTELKSDFEIIDLEWRGKYGYSPIEHLKTRMKKPRSLIKKVEERQIPLTLKSIEESIKDIAGVRIVTSFIDDIYMLKEHIENREDIRVIKVKDYINHPKESGYKSLHIIVETEVILSNEILWVPVEIQIRSLSMDFWASTEHKLNYKYQGKHVPESAKKRLVDLSNAAFLLDQKMSDLRNQLLTNAPLLLDSSL
ncbi:GTP pyrophosphokinase [Scopulibacillus cellulosilyticus]|uniref:GTP pyrophosphokinase family protein n=1 Tax=Scopulibacillus cellulosilyticus TaxID=2665665 RepID=A0ABW2Q1C1_9BACL